MSAHASPDADKVWEQVCTLLADALELSPAERPAFLAHAEVSPEVRAEVASLLAASADKNPDGHPLDRGLPSLPALRDGDTAPPASSPWIGRHLGPYQVEREIGHGGMGVVLLARRADGVYERAVAIKVIHAALSHEEFARRFRRETRILARLQHPDIVTLLDAGTTEERQPFLVMEYVDGVPIHVYAERETLDLQQLLALVITLCGALSYAHAQGVIHRDVKPGNVLVGAGGELKLLDFGIARLVNPASNHPEQTLTEFRAVTPTYASPEQIAGGEASVRSDVYSVGVLLHLLITGSPPFQFTGLSTEDILRVLKTAPPVRTSRAARERFAGPQATALDAVIGRAICPDPESRYESMAALQAELQRVQAHRAPLASALRYRVARNWRAHRALIGQAALVCAVVGLSVSAVMLRRHEHIAAPSPVAVPRVSLAVVPLASGSAEPAWPVAAAQEALTTEIASGDQVRVVASASVAQALRDLHLASRPNLTPQEAAQLGQLLGVQYLLEEHATANPAANSPSGTLHLTTALDRVSGGERLVEQAVDISFDQLGPATQQLAVRVARLLPLKRTFTPSPSLLPHQVAAVRAYAEGLEHMQALEPKAAQLAFSRAVAMEPASPLIHIALARTWDMLGYRQRAINEATAAAALTAGLPVRTRLVVQTQANEIRQQWAAAIAGYKTLREYDPDDIEYVLGLARSQLAANQAKDALSALQAAASMPSLLGADPRLELLASAVEESLGKHADALRSADEVLAAGRERGATQLMAQAQSARASALESLGRVDEGMAAAQQAGTLFASAGDEKGRAVTLISMGNFLEDHARYPQARDAYLQAREISRNSGDQARVGVAENDLGIIFDEMGDPREALLHDKEALAIFREVEDQRRVALELNNIGVVQSELGDIEAAKSSYGASLLLLQQLHDTRNVARDYMNLGNLLLQQDRLDEAEHDYEQAYAIYAGQNQITDAMRPAMGEAHIAWIRGRLAEAHARYQKVIETVRPIPEPGHLATALRADAHVLHDAGDEDAARAELKQSEDLRQANKEALLLGETRLSALLFELDDGKTVEPARFSALLDLFTAKGHVQDQVSIQLAWTRALLLQHQVPEARKHFEAAQIATRKSRLTSMEPDILPVQARLLAAEGRLREANALLDRAIARTLTTGDVAARMDLLLEKTQLSQGKHDRQADRLRDQAILQATHAGFLRAARQMQTP